MFINIWIPAVFVFIDHSLSIGSRFQTFDVIKNRNSIKETAFLLEINDPFKQWL